MAALLQPIAGKIASSKSGLIRATGVAAMDSRDDISLLQAIAQSRDSAAFAEFHQRYQQRAYFLALRILRNPELAEDAVQDAMLAIWNGADSAPPAADIAAWTMRIVINKSMDLGRSRRRSARREERMIEQSSKPQAPAAETLETHELIAALRRQIDQLPELECTLLACCYGAMMTHQKIAETVGIPRQTVSHKIQQTLERLRSDLSRAGVVAIVPLLSAEHLFEAMTTGTGCPAGMSQAALKAIANSTRSARILPHARPSTGWTNWLRISAGVCVVAAAAGGVWFASTSRTAPPLQTQTPAATQFVSRSWNFDAREQAADFRVAEGDWQWIPSGGLNGSGCMRTCDKLFRATIDIPATQLPCVITFSSRPLAPMPKLVFFSGITWDTPLVLGGYRNVGKSYEHAPNVWVEETIYVTERSVDTWMAGVRAGLSYVKPTPGALMQIAFRGSHDIDNFSIRHVNAAEIPDVHVYLDAVEKLPVDHGLGKIELPDLKSDIPDKPVIIEFF